MGHHPINNKEVTRMGHHPSTIRKWPGWDTILTNIRKPTLLQTQDGTPSIIIEDFGGCVWTASLSIQDFDTICIKIFWSWVYINCFTSDPGWDIILINEKTLGVVWLDFSITYLSNNKSQGQNRLSNSVISVITYLDNILVIINRSWSWLWAENP